MMKKFALLLSLFFSLSLSGQTVLWRNDRTGVYHEKGLLTSWPTAGPQLLWHYDGLGEGHSSVAIEGEKIYATGMTKDIGYLYVFDMNGKLLNKKEYGKEWDRSHNGSRGTVTLNEGKIYIHSGAGFLICMNQNSLDILWKRHIETDFGGKNIMWGVCESPLIIGEKVILSTGGRQHNVVALNKHNGSLIWSCAGDGDVSSYCSPLYIENQEVPQIVTMMASHILSIDAATGKKLWSVKHENYRKIHPNTPVYDGKSMLLCTSGYREGSVMLRLTNGGRSVEKVWEQKELETRTGGVVKVGNYAYMGGDPDNNRFWYCVDWNTGAIKYKDRTLNSNGAIIANDGMLYCYTERGEMALVKATPDKFDIVSKFRITLGSGPHWAHPVIYKGHLFVRHGDSLMAYRIH
jgi:outer membrane protein assembly factor BamB